MQNEINATIQLDKLILCCISTVEDNFNNTYRYYPFEDSGYLFGKTTITFHIDSRDNIYKYCYKVQYAGHYMGKIKFGLSNRLYLHDKVWFQIDNKVFYNNTLQYLPAILDDLNLKLNNITKMEIALDSYSFNFEPHLRKNLWNKENKVKLFGKYIDRKALEQRIRYWNYGSLDNPFKVRTLYIKNKKKVNNSKNKKKGAADNENNNTKDPKTTIELIAYNKSEEIRDFSPHKTYIADHHQAHNSNCENIYREEIRLESEELRRLAKKRKKPITLTDLLSKEFLYEIFTEYIDRIIVIKDSKNQKIDLFPKPFLGSSKGKLPLPLPEVPLPLIEVLPPPFIETSLSPFSEIPPPPFIETPPPFSEIPPHLFIEVPPLPFSELYQESQAIKSKELPIIKNEKNNLIKTKNINLKQRITNYLYKITQSILSIMRTTRKLSEETKQKISNSMKGANNPNFGKPLSSDHKYKIRQSMLNYWKTIVG